jgi:predicted TIM-barrel fold metal-dependent hydrolase
MNDDDDLRQAFRGAFQRALPTDACPSPEKLYEAYHRLLPFEETEAVLDHIAECPMCADAWRLAGRTDVPAPERS